MRKFLALMIALIAAVGAYQYYPRMRPQPAPAPPVMAPPPAIVKPLAPVLSAQDIQKVVESTRDSNPNVRWEALKFLVQVRAPQADGLVYEMLRQDSEASVRKNIVIMLGAEKGPKVTSYLAQALQDQEPEIRISALQMLDRRGDYAAAPAISELLRDTDDRVRLTALTVLNNLQQRQNDESRRLQEAARRRQEEALRRQREQASGGGR